MNFRSPPHARMECYFSGADVAGETRLAKSEWVHVVHTYTKGESLLYVNGVLDGATRTDSAPLKIATPARMWIGGWYGQYDFAGDVDEVRVSNVVRSPAWAKLDYENPKPLQTLVGHLVQPGNDFAVSRSTLDLARHIVDTYKIPVCILNGAVGGTRIDQHLPGSADRTNLATIYGRLLARVRAARLTHGIRAVFWHQGEADQGADGPDGGYGSETYRRHFHELAAHWQLDMPNLGHTFLFQIWPNACSQGGTPESDRLRDIQRTLPRDFARMSVMSTLGIRPEGGCHYPAAGYAEMARLMAPLVDQACYGTTFAEPVTA